MMLMKIADISKNVYVRIPTIILFQGLRIAVPIYLIIRTIINLGRIGTKNQKKFKVAQKEFIQVLLKSVIIFMVFTIIQFIILLSAETGVSDNIWISIRNLIIF